jgi:hypothetical protein
MHGAFRELLADPGVQRALLFSRAGDVLFDGSPGNGRKAGAAGGWYDLVEALGPARDADLVFEKCRIHIRRTEQAVLVVVMAPSSPAAVVRLKCDVLVAALDLRRPQKGIRRFFRNR